MAPRYACVATFTEVAWPDGRTVEVRGRQISRELYGIVHIRSRRQRATLRLYRGSAAIPAVKPMCVHLMGLCPCVRIAAMSVLGDLVCSATAEMQRALGGSAAADWTATAGDLEWTCLDTGAHVADD